MRKICFRKIKTLANKVAVTKWLQFKIIWQVSDECNYLFLWEWDIFKSMVTQCTANLASLVIYHILATQWYDCKYNAYRIYSTPQYAKLASSWLDDAQLMWLGSCGCSWESNVWHCTAFQYDLFRESHILLPKVGGRYPGEIAGCKFVLKKRSCQGSQPHATTGDLCGLDGL